MQFMYSRIGQWREVQNQRSRPCQFLSGMVERLNSLQACFTIAYLCFCFCFCFCFEFQVCCWLFSSFSTNNSDAKISHYSYSTVQSKVRYSQASKLTVLPIRQSLHEKPHGSLCHGISSIMSTRPKTERKSNGSFHNRKDIP